ncbi:zinc ribbon domain-containing protein [Candidatus Bathyarchaeota archaeon]|nr:MAG: zinc ribbon domain-containing protein [Candidatus Bathyarchaeota archaeon]
MYCLKCGSQLPDDAAFCSKCGARTSSTGQTP